MYRRHVTPRIRFHQQVAMAGNLSGLLDEKYSNERRMMMYAMSSQASCMSVVLVVWTASYKDTNHSVLSI